MAAAVQAGPAGRRSGAAGDAARSAARCARWHVPPSLPCLPCQAMPDPSACLPACLPTTGISSWRPATALSSRRRRIWRRRSATLPCWAGRRRTWRWRPERRPPPATSCSGRCCGGRRRCRRRGSGARAAWTGRGRSGGEGRAPAWVGGWAGSERSGRNRHAAKCEAWCSARLPCVCRLDGLDELQREHNVTLQAALDEQKAAAEAAAAQQAAGRRNYAQPAAQQKELPQARGVQAYAPALADRLLQAVAACWELVVTPLLAAAAPAPAPSSTPRCSQATMWGTLWICWRRAGPPRWRCWRGWAATASWSWPGGELAGERSRTAL